VSRVKRHLYRAVFYGFNLHLPHRSINNPGAAGITSGQPEDIADMAALTVIQTPEIAMKVLVRVQ